jgi:hypothetical protein
MFLPLARRQVFQRAPQRLQQFRLADHVRERE